MLYLTVILMLLAGLASASAHGYWVRALGILPLPALVPYRANMGFRLVDIHADVLLALIVYQFVQCDSVLGRMLLGW